jgi:non-specific serine/threonine protein kinase/serine/threonine-protein kinase
LAEPLYKHVLARRTSKLGSDHPETLDRQHDLANLYRYMKKFEQAIPLLEDALKRSKAIEHPATLRMQADLGSIYCDARHFADAIPLLEEVNSKGRKDVQFESVGNALLTAYVGAGKTTEVVTLATEQVRAARARFPADSIELAAALAPPGQALVEVQSYADAEPLLLIAYKALRQSETRSSPQVDTRLRGAGERLVQLYDAWGKPDEAAKWRKDLEAARTTDRPVKPPDP